MKKIIVILFLSLGFLNATDINREEGYRVALNFINSFLIEKNATKAIKYVSDDAVFRQRGKGSAMREVKDAKALKYIEIKEIFFFNRNTIGERLQSVNRRYNIERKFNIERIPLYLRAYMKGESSLGCIVSAFITNDRNKSGTIVLLFVFNKFHGKYVLEYMYDLI